ncbi:MAG TPA: TIGR01777 family oxidoreductase [Terriglobales bacterium]|nr:TIGR01777 family oxidoreductase [Terriglobales bacterium]
MNILVSGATGLVGSALIPALESAGHTVRRLVRQRPEAGSPDVYWDPMGSFDPVGGIEGFDAVVHLAGESVAARWTRNKKARILNSRKQGTMTLASAAARSKKPPKVMVSASAVGYYGNRGDEVLTEESAAGSDFLADVARQWETATAPAAKAGIRTVMLRIGFILSPRGGGLARMLPPFRMGLGGKLGSGRQWMSWVSIHDVVGAIQHALATEALQGPVNTVAPHPVTNAEFTRTLGRVLSRPTIFPMPGFAARLAFGEMGDALLLASQRVQPVKLQSSGFQFRHPELEGALRELLKP